MPSKILKGLLSQGRIRFLTSATKGTGQGNIFSFQSYQPLSTSFIFKQDASNLFFTDKHEWVKVDGTLGIIGISNYAQEALGDVVFAQLPEPDSEVICGEECGALESVKAASEIYSPVSGKVTEKNENVENAPSLINSSPMDKGWLFKVKMTNQKELEQLMTEQKYEEFLKTQESE